jgi:hypothetical protein
MKKIVALLVFVMLIYMCVSPAISENEKSISLKDYYFTKANIWYEKPESILSVNWHLGAILPVGTRVIIVRRSGNEIKFRNIAGADFTLINAVKYSTINLEKLFNQYFSKEDVTGEGCIISKFTKEEQENIKNGTIAEGMSKEAVLMAWGYPPSHRTPNLVVDLWTYWENRLVRHLVYFSNNKVTKIERTKRP